MKIVINKTEHGIYANKKLLVPGTNCLDQLDEDDNGIKAYVESGDIEVKESGKMSDKEQQKAVDNANTQATLETLKKTFKNVDTSKQKKKLDEFDKAIKETGVSTEN